MIRLIYKTHKWLAVVAVASTLAWFVSGVVMVLPAQWRSLSANLVIQGNVDPRLAGAPELEDASVSMASAIATVRARIGNPVRVTSMVMRRLPGRIAYEVGTSAGTYMVDAITGAVFTLDVQLAEQMVRAAVGTGISLEPATVQTTTTNDYRGRVPAYRIAAADGKGTVFYVSGPPIDVRYSDRLSRIATWIANWHDFFVLRSFLSDATVRLVMFGCAVVGTLMSAAGVLILLVQYKRWRQASRAAV